MKSVNEMTRKEFEELPYRENWYMDIECDSIVILPGMAKDLHDSGYRCMDFVAVRGSEPICKLSGNSDVIHINGIGDYGFNWLSKYKTVPVLIPPVAWSIDCLPKSGLLRLWAKMGIIVGSALPSFEIYAKDKAEALTDEEIAALKAAGDEYEYPKWRDSTEIDTVFLPVDFKGDEKQTREKGITIKAGYETGGIIINDEGGRKNVKSNDKFGRPFIKDSQWFGDHCEIQIVDSNGFIICESIIDDEHADLIVSSINEQYKREEKKENR